MSARLHARYPFTSTKPRATHLHQCNVSPVPLIACNAGTPRNTVYHVLKTTIFRFRGVSANVGMAFIWIRVP